MKISDKKQFPGYIITAEEILLQFSENRSFSQFFKKLPPFCGSTKTYAKFIVTNELLSINFALLHKCLFSRNYSFLNISRFPNICNKFYFKIIIFHRNKETLSGFFHAFSRLSPVIKSPDALVISFLDFTPTIGILEAFYRFCGTNHGSTTLATQIFQITEIVDSGVDFQGRRTTRTQTRANTCTHTLSKK